MSMSAAQKPRRTHRGAQVREDEPHMHLQRPSSAWSQDISHILDRCFGSLFSEESLELETIRNFTPHPDPDSYQNRYTTNLKKSLSIFEAQNELLDNASEKIADFHTNFSKLFDAQGFETVPIDLSLPPRQMPQKSELDLSLFEKAKLISPESYYPQIFQRFAAPQINPSIRPNYEIPTETWGQKLPNTAKIKDIATTKIQPYSNSSRTLESQRIFRPKIKKSTSNEIREIPKSPPHEKYIANVDNENFFIAEPQILKFEDYQPQKIYEDIISLRNISRYLREFRLTPPVSRFFTLSKQIRPGQDFHVAPGMAYQISVRFHPDSFGDYEDEIKIISQNGKSFSVPLKAARERPNLSLPAKLNCGYCLVNSKLCKNFTCTNLGGEAEFILSADSIWTDLGNESPILLGNFSIKPSKFALSTNQSVEIEIDFKPKSENYFCENLYFYCNNKTTLLHTVEGYGQIPQVDIKTLANNHNDSEYIKTPEFENGIKIANKLCTFDSVHLGHSANLELTIENLKSMPIFVSWNLSLTQNNSYTSTMEKQNTNTIYEELLRNFTVFPMTACIQALDSYTFLFTFTPDEVREYFASSQLFLTEDSYSSSEHPILAIIYLRGNCSQISIAPLIPFIDFGCDHLLGSQPTKSLELKNNGCSPLEFEWSRMKEQDNEKAVSINITPFSGLISPDQSIAYTVTIHSTSNLYIDVIIICNFKHYPNYPIQIPIQCQFRGPTIIIDRVALNFGLIEFGQVKEDYFIIRNNDSLKANISTQLMPEFDTNESTCQIEVIPSEFDISPFDSCQVCVKIKSMKCSTIHYVLICTETQGNASTNLQITGTVQRPIVVIEENLILEFDDLFVSVPVIKTLKLRNFCSLFAKFKWNPSLINSSKNDDIIDGMLVTKFIPEEGIISPHETCQIEVQLICNKEIGYVQDMLAICDIINAERPVIVSISANIRGMSVSFWNEDADVTPCEGKPTQVLDFGKRSLACKETYSLKLVNHTSIKSNVKLWFERFNCYIIFGKSAEKNRRVGYEFDKYLGNNILHKRMEQDQKRIWSGYLSKCNGIAFLAEANETSLEPFSPMIITLSAYSDMWGEYIDNLYCKVDGIDSVFTFQVKICIVGCPLAFHAMPQENPFLRFGTYPVESREITRKVRINNSSPVDIRVDWRLFTRTDPEKDTQIIDLEILTGNPFPLASGMRTFADEQLLSYDPVRVKLRMHDAIPSNPDTFTVLPVQFTILAKSNYTCDFKFNPSVNAIKEFGPELSGYGLAYMSLDSPPLHKEYIERLQGDFIEPLKLNMTAGVLHPRINLVPVNPDLDDEIITYYFPASNLIKVNFEGDFDSFNDAYHSIQQISIQNPTKQILYFDLILPDSITILNLDIIKTGEICSLKPQQLCVLKTALTFSKSIFSEFLPHNGWTLKLNKHNYLHYNENIRVKFLTGVEQAFPLEAIIELPLLKLSTDRLNFGATLIGNARSLQVGLYNYANACFSKWRAKIVSKHDSLELLRLDKYSGLLHVTKDGMNYSVDTLLVSFSPKEQITYAFNIEFSGEMGEQPLILVIEGRGCTEQEDSI